MTPFLQGCLEGEMWQLKSEAKFRSQSWLRISSQMDPVQTITFNWTNRKIANPTPHTNSNCLKTPGNNPTQGGARGMSSLGRKGHVQGECPVFKGGKSVPRDGGPNSARTPDFTCRKSQRTGGCANSPGVLSRESWKRNIERRGAPNSLYELCSHL